VKAARSHAYGQAPVVEEVAAPELGPTDVLIRVRAVGLNPLDVLLLSGKRREVFPLSLPYTPGTDVAGTVERSGSLVTRWRAGDRVVARLDPTRGGGLAARVCVPATALAAIGPTVSWDQAAAIPTAAGTAWQALFETAGVRPGQAVLIHAGAGGVGGFAIQLARLAGASVVATASGDGVALAHRLGAGQVIDYRAGDFAAGLSGIDLVLDPVGGDTQQRSYGVLRPHGQLVALASPPDEALAKSRGVVATRIHHRSDAGRLAALLGLVDAGQLEVVVDRQAGLDELDAALAHQASGRARGKIVVRVDA